MTSVILSCCLLALSVDAPVGLRQRVEEYWRLLQSRDKVSAISLVAPESRQTFVNRKDSVYNSFKIDSFAPASSNREYVVKVLVTGQFLLSDQPITMAQSQHWIVGADGKWYLKLPEATGKRPMEELFNVKKEKTIDADVELDPLIVNFQPTVGRRELKLTNRLQTALRLESIDFDETLAAVVFAQRELAPGQSAVLVATRKEAAAPRRFSDHIRLVFARADGGPKKVVRVLMFNSVLTEEQKKILDSIQKSATPLGVPPPAQAPPKPPPTAP